MSAERRSPPARPARSQLIDLVGEKTTLAGSNRMELLLFGLGGAETFGINVFKVREVCEYRAITAMPNTHPHLEGIISLRGSIIPVIDLAACVGGVSSNRGAAPSYTPPASEEAQSFPGATSGAGGKLIVAEFSSSAQAFHVRSVDRIVRVAWDRVRAPHGALGTAVGSLVTAITELDDGCLVSILDVEQVLANVMGETNPPLLDMPGPENALPVFFADDSPLARRKIAQVLDQLGLPHQHATNGLEAWQRLQALAAPPHDRSAAGPLHTRLGLILVDAEMPEMDGYVLTRNIKADPRFEHVPVLMHSSLSSIANRKLGQQVGVDAYVAKFHFEELANAISTMLNRSREAA